MKKILEKGTYITLFILITIASYGQTLQNPTFGNTTTNTLSVKTAPTATTDPYVSTISSTGVIGKVTPSDIPLSIIPPTTHYTPVTPNLKGHFQGIDNAIGNIPLTTAGNTTRVWFTGDATTITAGTFYLTNPTSKGTVANVSQSVINDDNQKKYFTQDLIGQPFATATLFPPGVYAGNLSASTTPNSAQQRFTVELYKCDNNGTPIASGIAGAPVGDLGVTVILILDSGLLTLADGSVTNVPVSASLASQLSVAVGERIRYHVSAEKVGTASSNITESVWHGSSFNSFLDVPTPITSSGVSNVSTVSGASVTNALDALNTVKANDDNVVHLAGTETITGIKTFSSTVTALNGVLIGGILATGFIPKATGSNSVGNSPIYTDGTNIGVGTTTPISKVNVDGGVGDSTIFWPGTSLTRTSSTGNVLAAKIVLSGSSTAFGNLTFRVKTTASSGESDAFYTDALTINGATTALQANSLSGTGTRTVVADASGNLSATDAVPTSGTYTPTITNVTNITTSVATTSTYIKVGNVVTVTASFFVTPTVASTNSTILISLPINRVSFPANNIGSGSMNAVTNYLYVEGDTASTVEVNFSTTSSGASLKCSATFSYTDN